MNINANPVVRIKPAAEDGKELLKINKDDGTILAESVFFYWKTNPTKLPTGDAGYTRSNNWFYAGAGDPETATGR